MLVRLRSKLRHGFAVLAVSALVSHAAAAQAQTAPVVLPEISVSATHIPTPQSQLASSVTVITADDLARDQRRTIPEALNAVPGLNVVQNGGPGGQTSIFIRGTNSNHVKVMIDGIDAGDPSVTNGAFDFGHLQTGDVESIEVLRGPQSGLYGGDAIGGVISIITKRGEGPPKVTATVEGGSQGTFNQTARLSGAQANVNYAFTVMHMQSTNIAVTPTNQLQAGASRNNDNYNNWTYSTKLGADISDSVTVNLIARYTDAKKGFTGDDCTLFPLPCLPELTASEQRNHDLYTRGEVVWSLLDGKFKNYFGFSYTNQWTRYFDPNPDSGYTSPAVLPPFVNVGQRQKFDWRGVVDVAKGQTLVLGLEKQADSLRTDSTGTIDPFFNFIQSTTDAHTGNKAGYVELQSNFSDRVFLVSNVRYDDNESFGGHTTYRIAPAYIIPMTNTKLKGSYGTGFKPPTLYNLYANTLPYSVANPALKPEESKGYDFGLEQPLLQDRLRVGVTYYRNDIKNLTAFVSDPSTFVGTNINVDSSIIHGYEAFAALTVNSQFKLRGDYTYTHIDATSLAALQRRPAHKYSVNAIWTPIEPLELSATMIAVSSWFDLYNRSNFYSQSTGGYTIVNLAANYKVNDKVQVFGRIDNLFNLQYQEPTGYMRPSFGIFGGVRIASR